MVETMAALTAVLKVDATGVYSAAHWAAYSETKSAGVMAERRAAMRAAVKVWNLAADSVASKVCMSAGKMDVMWVEWMVAYSAASRDVLTVASMAAR